MGTASAMVASPMATPVAIMTMTAVTCTMSIAKDTVAVINNSSLCAHGNTPIR
jgi:hypothetical protein